MKKTTIAIIIAILAVGALGGIYLFNKEEPDTSPTPQISQTTDDDSSDNTASQKKPANSESFTAAQVATHDSESDCWTIINGNVYDITSYIPRHPGGDEILRACGVDGTSLFTQRQTSDGESVGSGTPHSSSAESQLEALKVGTLKN